MNYLQESKTVAESTEGKFIVQQCDGSGTRATGSGAIDGQIDRAELLVAIATWKRALRDDKPRTSRRSSVCTVS